MRVESLLYKALPVGFLFRDLRAEQAVITFYEKSINKKMIKTMILFFDN
jgi:hypothetical protein